MLARSRASRAPNSSSTARVPGTGTLEGALGGGPVMRRPIRAAIMYWPRNQATRADWLAA
ncbi:hypothetical protein [Roseomonas genomospecies 6]|uniref:hypothetical protein n=1 Tax=Roseomonas genomospecies 6 TaxID=214106 RepID=UPI001AD7CCFC|nr:hypothetical protein [Roseomonas genomospecies 6]